MKRFFRIMLAGLFLLSACSRATGIEVSKVWMRSAMKDGNGAVYFLLENYSARQDTLTVVTSQAAEAVEIHETKMDRDVMQMQQVTSVPIPGKGSVEFSPGGLHVMLIGLKQDLNTGDEIQVTLQFADHEDITLTVPVQEMEADGSMSDH